MENASFKGSAVVGYFLLSGVLKMELADSGSCNSTAIRLRAHHICCLPFLGSFEGRGLSFQQTESKINDMFLSSDDTKVVVIEGVDELCRECPLHDGERCNSPNGNEEAVRKWDAILLKELGVTFNTCLSCRQWHELVEQKVPFKICQKCQWKERCSIGNRLPPS